MLLLKIGMQYWVDTWWPIIFWPKLDFWRKKNFCSDKFYLVKLRSPLDFFAPSKVTLPPTLLSLWIGTNPPLAIIKKIKKIWNGICPGFWINWTNAFWRWLVTLYEVKSTLNWKHLPPSIPKWTFLSYNEPAKSRKISVKINEKASFVVT